MAKISIHVTVSGNYKTIAEYSVSTTDTTEEGEAYATALRYPEIRAIGDALNRRLGQVDTELTAQLDRLAVAARAREAAEAIGE